MDFVKIAHSIKNKLDRETCSIHLKHPEIKITGTSEPKFEITGCCEAFAKRTRDKAMEMLKVETKKAVEDEIKNMFKGF